MTSIWKRSLSLFLAFVMVFGMLPMNAFATTEEVMEEEIFDTTTDDSTTSDVVEEEIVEEDLTADDPVVETTEAATEGDPQVDEAVANVQAMIDALNTTITSDDDAYALEDAIAAVDDAMAELYTTQSEQLDYTNYVAANDALDAWWNNDRSQNALIEYTGTNWNLYVENSVQYLDILNGTITNGEGGLYTVFYKLYSDTAPSSGSNAFGSWGGDYRYATAKPTGFDSWAAKTEIQSDTSGSNSNLGHGTKYYISRRTSSTGYATSTNPDFTVRYYYVPTVTISGVTDREGTVAPSAEGATRIYAGDNNAVVTVPYVDGYSVTATYKGGSVTMTQNGTTSWTGTFTASDSSAVAVTYTEESTTGTVELTVNGEGTVAFDGTAQNAGKLTLEAKTYPIKVTPAAGYYVSEFKIGKTTVTAYDKTDRSMSGSLAVEAGESDTVSVTFTKQTVADGTLQVAWNPVLSANGDTTIGPENAKKTLDQRIIEAVIGANSNPNAAEWATNATVTFRSREASIAGGEEWCATNTYYDGTAVDGHKFGDNFVSGTTTETVRISYTDPDGIYDGYTGNNVVEKTITLIDSRGSRTPTYTLGGAEATPIAYNNKDGLIDLIKTNVSLSGLSSWDGITLSYNDSDLPAAEATKAITVTVTGDAGDADYVPATSFTVYVKAPKAVAVIDFVENEKKGNGTYSFGSLTADGTISGGTYTLTVTPADLNGTGDTTPNSAMYVESVAVTNGTLANEKWTNGVYTADVTVANDTNVTITITYGTRTLTLTEADVKINGYYEKNSNWDKSLGLLKNRALSATGATAATYGAVTEYTVVVSYGDGLTLDLDDTSFEGGLGRAAFMGAVEIGAADEGKRAIAITHKASQDGKYVAVTASTKVQLVEERDYVDASIGSGDYLENDDFTEFETAVKGAVSVYYDGNTDNTVTGFTATLVPVADETNKYTVTVTVGESEYYLATTTQAKDSDGNAQKVTYNVKKYDVTFVDHDGTTLQAATKVANGTAPTYDGKAPTRGPDMVGTTVKGNYTFAGWDSDGNTETIEVKPDATAFPAVNKANVTYKAVYEYALQKYTITWKMDDGSVIDTTQVEYGTVPTHADPTKAATAQYTYTFTGWNTTPVAVAGEATYTATFTSTVNKYTVTYFNEDGKTVLDTQTEIEYGSKPEYKGKTSTAELAAAKNDVQFTWTFDKWVPTANVAEDGTITGNAAYKASYTSQTNKYTVTWTANGTTFGTQYDEYGTAITLPEGTPADYVDDNGTNWTFDKWIDADKATVTDETLGTIAGNVTYTAVYKQSGNDAKIIHADGSETYCKDLVTAVSQAQAGETVVMLEDATLTSKLIIDKAITIDGDGHSVLADTSVQWYTQKEGKLVKNYYPWVVLQADGIVFEDIVINSNNVAGGVKVENANNVFKNVKVLNTKADAITVTGSLTLKERLEVNANSYSAFGAGSKVTAEQGTVFVLSKFVGSVSPATADLKDAVDTEGNPFFAGYSSTAYYTDLNSATSLDGITLLKGQTLTKDMTVSSSGETIDLNGKTLTIADGKTITVNGALTVENAGSITGNIVLNNTDATVAGPEGLTVVKADSIHKEYYVKYENGKYFLHMDLPDVKVTNIKGKLTDSDPDLTFALNFAITDEYLAMFDPDNAAYDEAYVEALMAEYGSWYTDYVMTISGLSQESVTFNANGKVDGYLAGQYDSYSENWVSVPLSNVTVKNGESLYIMEYAAKLMGKEGLRYTLAEVAAIVQNFDCGVYFTPEFLAANPNMQVTLELKVFTEDANGNIGEGISVATNKFENDVVAIIAAKGAQTEYYTTLAAATAAAQTGETVTLLKDDTTGTTVNNQITLVPGDNTVEKLTLGAADASITAPSGLDVTSSVEKMTVIYAEGKYILVDDVNSNNVADELETAEITVNITGTGSGSVALAAAEGATLTKNENGTYTLLFNSKNDATKVVTVTATPTDTTNDDNNGHIDYVITNPGTVNVVDGANTIKVEFGAHTLNATNGTVKINKYYTAKSDKEALATLRTNILTAAGLDPNGAYVVTTVVGIQSLGDWATWTVEVKDGDAEVVKGTELLYNQGYLANELNKGSYQFTITDGNGVSKTVTMKIEDSRVSAGLVDYTETKDQAKTYDSMDDLAATVNTLANGKTVNPNGVTVTVSANSTWPAVAGKPTQMVYTVTYADSAAWIGDEATITVWAMSKHNNCTAIEGGEFADNGSVKVNDTAADSTEVSVPGNSTVTVEVTPNSDKVVETISVTKKVVDEEGNVSWVNVDLEGTITYSNKVATVKFISDGSVGADEYVVSATYSPAGTLDLAANGEAVIKYMIGTDDKAGLAKMAFDAMVNANGNITPAGIAYDAKNVKVTYNAVKNLPDWAQDVASLAGWDKKNIESADSAISVGGQSITHQFGSLGEEEVTISWTDPTGKYGTISETAILTVFNAKFNVIVDVEIKKPDGVEANIKDTYSDPSRTYQGKEYFEQNKELTVTLTPAGDVLNAIWNSISGTYSSSMPYIKSVTVYDSEGKLGEDKVTFVRGEGSFSLDNLGGGQTYNAAVTFTPDANGTYRIVVEYDVLTLEQTGDEFEMEMYQAGTDEAYDAKVPSVNDIINTILGEKYAKTFVETYGGSFTVQYGTDATGELKWEAVTPEVLLGKSDGATLNVRITWKETGATRAQAYTYYPVAVTADVTLVDQRTPTSVAGSIPEKPVNYESEDELIADLKNSMGLAIMAEGAAIDVDYTVASSITETVYKVDENGETVLDENGDPVVEKYLADVTVTYVGAAEGEDFDGYKPTSKIFEDVPVANRPDDATIKVSISGASDTITNKRGDLQRLDPATGIYTVIGNGEYTFKFNPNDGKAIESVTVNGKSVTLTYKEQVASFSMKLDENAHYEVVVETVDSAFKLDDPRTYNFAYGVMDPVNKDIVDAAVTYPAADDIAYDKVNVQYKARSEGTVPVELPDIDLGFTVIELGSFDVDLGELWLDPNAEIETYDLEKIVKVLVSDVVEMVSRGELAAADAFTYIQDELKGLTLNAHAFGEGGDGSTETIRISYEDDKYLLAETVTDVTIHDYRIATELSASDCEVTFGYSLAQLIEASGAQVMAEDAAVSGLSIKTEDLYLHASEDAQEVTLYFAGDVNYQPCKITINVTVNKAAASIDYDSQMVTYGDEYELPLSVSPTVMPDGTTAEIDLMELMIGLDMHSLLDVDIEDKTVGIDQAIAYIQIRLPESIRNLPLVGQYLQGEFTLGEFTDLVNSLSDVLGIDEGSMDTLNQVVEAITGITDNMEIKIRIKDEDFHPTNIGVYIAGAVTVDSDFETAYTADYLIIAPKTIEAELAWDYEDQNGIMTLPAYQEVFAELMGAHVVENEIMTGDVLETANGHIKYLILGINDETSEFLTTDVYGNIKANIWTSNDAITDNGAYVQIAYMLNWGNEIYYAMPIVRSFVITPNTVDVQFIGHNNEDNNERHMVYNGKPQGMDVKVTNKADEVIVNTLTGVNKMSQYAELTVTYVGLQTNTQTYNSTTAPEHAGAYAAVATYIEKDADGNILAVGVDTGVMVIEPTESDITMKESVVHTFDGEYVDLEQIMEVKASSTAPAEYVTDPDTTIISAAIASTGDFSENGWEAVTGNVNVDFPEWVDGLIETYAPSVVDGITVSELSDKLIGKLPAIEAELTELGATEEVANALNNLMGSITDVLAEMPDDMTLSFQDDVKVNAVGAYVVVGIVTDSDHYPAVDAGVLVIVPDVEQVTLKWNYEDENGIFTRDLLEHIDLLATAYDENGDEDADATAKITYQFIGINSDNEPEIYTNPETLPNGAYVELAYIELMVGGEMVVSDMIARPVVIVASECNVNVENVETVFDNSGHDILVTVKDNEGNVIDTANGELTVVYAGMQTNGKAYLSSTNAPVHAGAYEALVTYTEYDAEGELRYYGANAGYVLITPAQATIDVTGGTVEYDGEEHAATVTADSVTSNVTPDTTVITGTAGIKAEVDTLGVDAITGNVNIDFPEWLDEALVEFEFKTEGVDTAYVIDFIGSYRDDLVGLVPSEELVALGVDQADIDAVTKNLNDAIDELLDVLELLPKDVSITFEDDVTFTEPGAYVYYGMVTDSDHYPAADTGLLVIEKMTWQFGAWHEVVPYDGEEHTVFVPNDTYGPVKADYVTMILDRQKNNVNFLIDADLNYVLTSVERILDIELPEEISIADLREKLGADNVDAFTEAMIKVLDAVMADMEVPEPGTKEYAESTYRDLTLVKQAIESLPKEGTITFNGPKPVDVGAYEFFILAHSQYYKTMDASAVLFIEPIRVVVDDNDDQYKYYGEDDPEELTAAETYYSIVGREDPYNFEGNTDGKYAEDYDMFLTSEADATFSHIVYEKVAISELPDDIGLTYEVVREEGEDVGFYDMSIVKKTFTDSKNYVLEIVEDSRFEIKPVEVTVEIAAVEDIYYGEEIPTEFDYTVSFAPETLSETAKAKILAEMNLTVARESDSADAGTYAIVASYNTSDKGNYTVVANKSSLTIKPAEITITVADQTKVYGEEDPVVEPVVEVTAGKVDLDVALTREEGIAADTYKYLVSYETSDNWIVTEEIGALTITKKPITVTVNPAEKVYGDEDPAFDVTIEPGLAYNDKINFSFTREEGNAADEYKVTASLENVVNAAYVENYDITFEEGILTVKQRPITITMKDDITIYGLEIPELTYTITDGALVNGDTELMVEPILKDAAEGAKLNAGTYVMTANDIDPNYEITVVDGKLLVSGATVDIVIQNEEILYGETPEFGIEIVVKSGALTEEEKANITNSMTMKAGSIDENKKWTNWNGSAGEFIITHTGDYGFMNGENIYYRIVKGKLTVTSYATVTIAPEANKYTIDRYEDPKIVITAKDGNKVEDADGVKFTELLSVSYETYDVNGEKVDDPEETVGTYTIKPVYTAVAGYEVKVVTGELEVLPLAAEIVERPDEQFNTLQDAVDEATDGETIKLLKSGEIAVVQKAVTILKNDKTATVAALAGYTVEETDTAYIVKAIEDVEQPSEPSDEPKLAYIDVDKDGEFDEGTEVLQPLQEALYDASEITGISVEKPAFVRLYADHTDENAVGTVIIPTNVVLDIQEHTLEATYVIGLEGSILTGTSPDDNGNGGGVLKANQNDVRLDDGSYTIPEDGYSVIPIWDEDHYKFCPVKFFDKEVDVQGLRIDEAKGTIRYVFRHKAYPYYRSTLLTDNGGADNGITAAIEISWDQKDAQGNKQGRASQTFVYTDKMLQQVSGPGYVFTFDLSGYSALNLDLNSMEIVAKMISNTGAMVLSEPVHKADDKLK